MMNLLTKIAMLSAFVVANALAKTFTGTGRQASTADFVPNECAYDQFSTQFPSSAESRFAYVSKSFWEEEVTCGRCAKVSSALGATTPTIVMLISKFEETCTSGGDCKGNLRLSPQAYREMLNGQTGSRFPIKWELVPCPDSFVHGNMEVAFHDATNAQMLTVQPRNFKGIVTGMDVRFEDGKVFSFGKPGVHAPGSYRFLVLEGNTYSFAKPFTLIVKTKKELIEIAMNAPPAPRSVLVTDKQFE